MHLVKRVEDEQSDTRDENKQEVTGTHWQDKRRTWLEKNF